MYLTFEEYREMGGTLDEAEFYDYGFEASAIIDWYTFNRLDGEAELPEAVKRLTFRLIKLAKLRADALTLGQQETSSTDAEGKVTTTVTGSSIASQSNDGVSISYNLMSASEAFDKLQAYRRGGEIDTLVKSYLNGVKNALGRRLLYRGRYPNE